MKAWTAEKLSAFYPLKGENVREGVRRQFVLAERGEKSPETWLGARIILPAPARTRLWVRNREALVCMSSFQQPGCGAGELQVVLGHSRRSAAQPVVPVEALAHVLPLGGVGNSFLLLHDVRVVGDEGKKTPFS